MTQLPCRSAQSQPFPQAGALPPCRSEPPETGGGRLRSGSRDEPVRIVVTRFGGSLAVTCLELNQLLCRDGQIAAKSQQRQAWHPGLVGKRLTRTRSAKGFASSTTSNPSGPTTSSTPSGSGPRSSTPCGLASYRLLRRDLAARHSGVAVQSVSNLLALGIPDLSLSFPVSGAGPRQDFPPHLERIVSVRQFPEMRYGVLYCFHILFLGLPRQLAVKARR